MFRPEHAIETTTTGEVWPPRRPKPCSCWGSAPLDGTGSSVAATPAIAHRRGSWSEA